MSLMSLLITAEMQRAIDHLTELSDKNLSMHQERKNTSFKQQDKIIFIISTGTLVLSITFIGYLKTVIYWPHLLPAAWFFLVATVILNFVTHISIIRQARRQIEIINQWRETGFPDPMDFQKEKVDKDSQLNHIVRWTNRYEIATVTCLIVGLLFLFTFATLNLIAQNKVNQIVKEKQEAREALSDELLKRQLESTKSRVMVEWEE